MAGYVKFSPNQINYSEKNLLFSEMQLLNILKKMRRYRKLRKLEFDLKTQVKRRISEILEEMRMLDKILPKTPHERKDAIDRSEITERKRRSDLEQKISDIQRRLEELY